MYRNFPFSTLNSVSLASLAHQSFLFPMLAIIVFVSFFHSVIQADQSLF